MGRIELKWFIKGVFYFLGMIYFVVVFSIDWEK